MDKNKLLYFLFILLLVFTYSFRLWQKTGCKNFNEFYFNSLSVKINVESQRGLDQNSSPLVSKLVHNKVLATPNEISKSLAKIWEPRLLLDILSPLGLILFSLSLFWIFKNKSKAGIVHLSAVFLSSLWIITSSSPIIQVQTFIILLCSFTLWGVNFFLKSRVLKGVYLLLIVYSLWFYAINWQMPNLCREIFFK